MLIRERLAHKRPVFSFEFFPPRTENGEANLMRSLERLAPLEPDFVSVTYGAGGSTRTRTLEVVRRIRKEFGMEPLAHLTCVGSSRDELAAVIDSLGEAGVQNVLALRGDPPQGQTEFTATEGGFAYANELIEFIASRGDFCIGAACYPEVHPEAESAHADLANLKRKVDAGADFLVSQLFFDNNTFFDFQRQAKEVGIEVPIIAGIMPVTNVGQIERFAALSGAAFPTELAARFHAVADDRDAVVDLGIEVATELAEKLLAGGAPGLHFYTLNRSGSTREIFRRLTG
jgi:methylenetetrahydrofolate reductase (NADPH)